MRYVVYLVQVHKPAIDQFQPLESHIDHNHALRFTYPKHTQLTSTMTSSGALAEGIFSLLDTDLYKLTMQCAVLKYFPQVRM